MPHKKLLKYLGFTPKENTSGIHLKKYANCGDYSIEIDFENEKINYGNLIGSESKTTQNFSQKENWVVLECVDRLITKGYQPQNIILEKTWATGHGTSGRLDILVTRNDGTAYLMIECKTWGTEFDKELKKVEKDGGQLFTYFQQDKNADVLMLYASEYNKTEVNYKNLIIKIEEDYRQTGNVKDLFERWNKLPKTNGIFENWVTPYEYQSKALTKRDLRVLRQEDSSFIFNRFLEILRHNVVSDKPNAFNKIFTLFLCKIVDENRNEDDQLHFQWIEGEDNHISFQKRLTDLYRRGMKELLEKQVTDVSDTEFDARFQQIEDKFRSEIKDIFTELRLKKNNEFAIKEVYDDESFNENAKVVKEIVELLQVYQLRYNYRQQFLSDFFELLLTTGLKQESGQFFTPVPIARFILRSIPINMIAERKLKEGNKNDLLPIIIDYAAGSGHFVTESMEDVQKYIDSLDENIFTPATKRAIKKWKDDQFDWAEDYVYAIEKDYRLVKTAKVSCYLHGDGLAKVIHGDGLGDFTTSKEFKELLKIADKTYPQDNKQFDLVVSNPPYSVSAFKGSMIEEERAKNAFDLYSRLTDQSSEIECLFIERTKQLLKDGGIAGIILPSSILSNSGIYSQTREIIFKYFEIIAITELGNNTFMATGTNTVILFLRRRNNADWVNIRASIDKFAINQQDVTINGIEKPISKYIAHVWEGITYDDYLTLIQKQPNKAMQKHELYKEYHKKIKAKNEQDRANSIINIELDKLFYFIMAYPQRIVLVKSGEKDAEKQFLGYEFSYRRGSEGIHPIQRKKTIDECTKLYDVNGFENPEKASTYIYKTFKGEYDFEIDESLQKNISQHDLVDMMTFDRVEFEKSISLAVKKKVVFHSKYDQARLGNISLLIKRGKSPKYGSSSTQIIKSGQARGYYEFDFSETHFASPDFILDERKLQKNDLLLNSSGVGTAGRVTLFDLDGDFVVDSHITIIRLDQNIINPKFALNVLGAIGFKTLEGLALGQSGQIEISSETINNFKLPIPPKDIQDKIVNEIKKLEQNETGLRNSITNLENEITDNIRGLNQFPYFLLGDIAENWDSKRKPVTKGHRTGGEIPYYGASGIVDFVSDYLIDDCVLLISEDGANLKSRVSPIAFTATGKMWVNNHAHILKFEYSVTQKLVELYINETDISEFITGQAQPKLNQQNLNRIKIPLPGLEVQKKIVQDIENIEDQINGLKKQIGELPMKKEKILKKYLV
jgi:type I restriction enzyme M protein